MGIPACYSFTGHFLTFTRNVKERKSDSIVKILSESLKLTYGLI